MDRGFNTPTASSSAKPIPFQACQFVLDRQGTILDCDPNISDKIGAILHNPTHRSFRQLLISINSTWEEILPDTFDSSSEAIFLPWDDQSNPFAIGLTLNRIIYNDHIFVTISPDLAPQEMLRGSAVTDFYPHSEVVAQMFLRLQLSESRLNNYMQNFPGIFFCQRPDLSFTYIGPKFETTLGQSIQPLYKNGGSFLARIYEKDRAFFLQEIEKNSSRAKTFSFSYRLRHAQKGSILYFMDVRTPLYSPAGLLLGYEGVWLDISRQSIAENRLTSTAWKENLATITSGLVHDFSNIMAGIHSLSELYHNSLDEDDSMYNGLGQIKKSSMQAQKLVRRIIDINREHTGQRDYHNLENLIKDQLDLIEIILPKHTQIQQVYTEEELPVYIDDVAFRQMLLNMAMNARDAFDPDTPGTISITVRRVSTGDAALEGTVSGSFQADKDAVEIIFSDDGSGIEEAHLTKIFAPFFTTKEATKGSGFGLYNAKLFIENNRGRMSVKSQLGKGTAFHILLPLADFTEMENEAKQQDNDPLTYNKRRPSFIVYASKDPSAFDIVSQMRQNAWEVITFDSYEQLRHYLKEAEFLPHMLCAIDVGHDASIEPLLDYMNVDYPGIKICLQVLGRNPDEIPVDIKNKADIIASEADMSHSIIKMIESLIC